MVVVSMLRDTRAERMPPKPGYNSLIIKLNHFPLLLKKYTQTETNKKVQRNETET